MAVSKRLRYEVLRRDNHACRYCGAAAPEVKLVVDHVVPQALGGRDEASNLVTACDPCNSGKSASAPDQQVVDDVAQDALRWASVLAEVAAERARHRQDLELQADALMDHWATYRVHDQFVPRPNDAERTLINLMVAGLGSRFIEQAIDTAMAAPKVQWDNVWRYMCGICWREVAAVRDETARRMKAPPAPVRDVADPPSPLDAMRWTLPRLTVEHLVEYAETLCALTDARTAYWSTPAVVTVHRAWVSPCWTRDQLSELAFRAGVLPTRVSRDEVDRWVDEDGASAVLCATCCADLIASGHA